MTRNGIVIAARDHEIADYRKGLERGTLKSATPNVVRSLIARIDELKEEAEQQARKIDHGCANFPCQECDR